MHRASENRSRLAKSPYQIRRAAAGSHPQWPPAHCSSAGQSVSIAGGQPPTGVRLVHESDASPGQMPRHGRRSRSVGRRIPPATHRTGVCSTAGRRCIACSRQHRPCRAVGPPRPTGAVLTHVVSVLPFGPTCQARPHSVAPPSNASSPLRKPLGWLTNWLKRFPTTSPNRAG